MRLFPVSFQLKMLQEKQRKNIFSSPQSQQIKLRTTPNNKVTQADLKEDTWAITEENKCYFCKTNYQLIFKRGSFAF